MTHETDKGQETTAKRGSTRGQTWADDLSPDSGFMTQLHQGQEHYVKTGEPIVDAPTTGLPTLDELMGGLRPGRLVIVGARPSVGKSLVLMDWARVVAKQGKKALFFSLDNSEDHNRALANWTATDIDCIRRKTMAKDQCERVDAVVNGDARQLARNLMWGSQQAVTLTKIAAQAQSAEARGLDVVFVDYLQLVRPAAGDLEQPQHVRIGNICRGLKQLAVELDICVVVGAQLNRQRETSDRRPRLHHLADSGSIEQDADQVVLLDRCEAEVMRSTLHEIQSEGMYKTVSVLLMYLEKNRHGNRSAIACWADWKCGRFEEMPPGTGPRSIREALDVERAELSTWQR